MLEGRGRSSQRACSAKRNFPVWNLFCVYEEESISHSEKYLTLDPVFRALANSWQHSPSSESACLVVPGPAASEGWAGGAAGKGEPSLGCCWSPWHQQPHPAWCPHIPYSFCFTSFSVCFQIPLRQVMMKMTMMSQKIQVICFSGRQRPFLWRSCGSQAVQLIWVFT